jgi:hypothetical protein
VLQTLFPQPARDENAVDPERRGYQKIQRVRQDSLIDANDHDAILRRELSLNEM